MLQESTGMNKLEWLSNLFEEVNLFPNPSTWSLCHSYETIPYPSHCLLNEETHLKKESHLEWKIPRLKILCIYLYRYWKGKCKSWTTGSPCSTRPWAKKGRESWMWEVIMWYQDVVLVSEQPQTFTACSPLPWLATASNQEEPLTNWTI